MGQEPQRLIVGVSGASGIVYAAGLLQALRRAGIETHLVMSRTARLTLVYETDMKPDELCAMADMVHPPEDMAASISSGSFRTMGMIIAPCSMRSLGEIASGATSTLLTRAADVVLKERRRLVLLVRETPLHAGHLRNMLAVTEMGGIIAPPVPAFYSKPKTVDDLVRHTVGRTLDLFDIPHTLVERWEGPKKAKKGK
jgi:4-hydroxy-3-polyprenylbenzoate decarboxylase